MQRFIDSKDCTMRVHCRACRGSRSFREAISKTYRVDAVDYACPIGLPIAGQARRMGDWMATFFGWLKIPKPANCGCAKRQAWLNRNQAWLAALGMASLLTWAWR